MIAIRNVRFYIPLLLALTSLVVSACAPGISIPTRTSAATENRSTRDAAMCTYNATPCFDMYAGDQASIPLTPGTFLCKYQTSWTFSLSSAYKIPAYVMAILSPQTASAPPPADPNCTWQPKSVLTIIDGGSNPAGSADMFEQYTDGGFGIFYFHAGTRTGQACLPADTGDPGYTDNGPGTSFERRGTRDLAAFCRKLWGQVSGFFGPPHIYPVVFEEGHFASRLTKRLKSPISQVEAAVVAQIQAIAAADQNFPNNLGTTSRTYPFVFYDQGAPVSLEFRVYFVANGSATIPEPYISVGTIY